MSVVPLSDFKAHANITSSANDAEAQRHLDAAEAWVESYLGAPLGVGARTVTARSSGRVLVLPATGLSSVLSVTDPDGYATTGYTVDLAAGIVTVPYARAGAWTVSVAAGEPLGADVALATLIIAKHLWDTQRGQGPSGPFSLQDEDVGDVVQGVGYAIPNRARALLDPHVVPVTA